MPLVDAANLERHAVVAGSSDEELQPDFVTQKFTNGESVLQNCTFAAPSEKVKTVVHFGPFAPFRDVPVGR